MDFLGSTTPSDMLSAVAASTQTTFGDLWPIALAIVGIPIAFVVIGYVVSLVRHAVGRRSR